jgi:predicted DNA-binding transcriptional regulator YafY
MYWGRHLVKMLRAVEVLARPGGASMEELAAELDVDRRTSYRIKETLEELNFPIYEDTSGLDGRKRYRFEERYLRKLPNLNLPELNLSLAELIALYFIRGQGRCFRGTDIERNIEGAFSKLDAFMPEGLAGKLDQVRTLFVTTGPFAKDYRDKQELIEALTDAIFRRQTCRVNYHAFYDDTVKTFRIDPLHFFERDGGLYLFVRTTDYGHIRVLAVERIRELTREEASFDYPDDFDPEALLQSAFGIIYDDPIQVQIRFTPDQARYIKERQWAAEQALTEHDDGSVTLTMTTSGWFDVKRWVLSFGAAAQVLAPAELRAEIVEDLREMAREYKKRRKT